MAFFPVPMQHCWMQPPTQTWRDLGPGTREVMIESRSANRLRGIQQDGHPTACSSSMRCQILRRIRGSGIGSNAKMGTRVVVEERKAPDCECLVPMEHVASAEALTAQEEFIGTELIRAKAPHHVNAGFLWFLPHVLSESESEFMQVEEEQIPKGELAVKRGACVEARDGHADTVNEFAVDPATDAITHLIIGKGRLRGGQDVAIPVPAIDRRAEQVVYLTLTVAEIGELPELPIRRCLQA